MIVAFCFWLCLLLVPIPGLLLIAPAHRRRILTFVLWLVPVHIGILVLANQLYNFVPSETDAYLYYSLSIGETGSVKEILIGQTFSEGVFEGQFITKDWGGLYLKILTISNLAFGDSLVLRKAVSLPFLWLTVIAVYSIAMPAFGARVAGWMAAVTGLLPTLWYPFTVLYRDTITMSLHVLALAGFLCTVLSQVHKTRSIVITVAAIGLLFAFRPGTLLINAGVFLPLAVFALMLLRGGMRRPVVAVPASLALIAMVYAISRYQSAAGFQDTQVGAGSGLRYFGGGIGTLSRQWIRNLHLFIVSEPTLFSRKLDLTDVEQYRGIMNGIWVLFGASFMLVGTWFAGGTIWKWFKTMQRINTGARPMLRQNLARIDQLNFADSLNVTGMTCMTILWYAFVWSVVLCELADFTRWRLPVVPILCMLAVIGWVRAKPDLRWVVMIMWGSALFGWRVLINN